MDLELELMPESGHKDKGSGPVARISVLQISSMPVDQEHKTERDRDFSDEEDEFSSGEEEPGDLSDSEPLRSKLPHARVSNNKIDSERTFSHLPTRHQYDHDTSPMPTR